jgi:hypothetical protein
MLCSVTLMFYAQTKKEYLAFHTFPYQWFPIATHLGSGRLGIKFESPTVPTPSRETGADQPPIFMSVTSVVAAPPSNGKTKP